MRLSTIINNILHKFGLAVHRYVPPTSPTESLVASLRKFDIDLVLDLGANIGQFASDIRHWGYAGRIVSFDPLSLAHGELLQSSASDPLWDVYPRCALGGHIGEVEINIAGNSQSSSILSMLESHRSAAPELAYQGKEIVPIKTLDSVAGQYLKDARAAFLKIDTQGFEWQVLDGARETLPQPRGGAIHSRCITGPVAYALKRSSASAHFSHSHGCS